MPQIKEIINLKCSPKEAFEKMSKVNFIDNINSAAGVDTEILYHDDRLIKYKMNVSGVGTWESERILIPESNLIVTHRCTPLAPFKYMIVIYAIKQQTNGSQLIYIEEFEVADKRASIELTILSNIFGKVKQNLKYISDYLGGVSQRLSEETTAKFK